MTMTSTFEPRVMDVHQSGVPASLGADQYRFSRELFVLTDPAGLRAESYGGLRTHLLAHHVHDKRRGLAICGATAAAGTAAVAANLASAMALSGVRTLLIDTNLRAPAIHTIIEPLSAKPTLRDCLRGDASLSDAIHDQVLPNLSVLYAGEPAMDTPALISGHELKAVIDICMRDFDLTICDTPPSSASSDARRIASLLRYAMVIVKRNESYVSDARTLIEELRTDRVTVLGSFMNDG